MGDEADEAIDAGMMDGPFGQDDEFEECDTDNWGTHHGRNTGHYIGSGPREITCKYCQKHGLHWTSVDGRWKLSDEKGIHNCRTGWQYPRQPPVGTGMSPESLKTLNEPVKSPDALVREAAQKLIDFLINCPIDSTQSLTALLENTETGTKFVEALADLEDALQVKELPF